MYITKLKINDFKCFSNFEIDFPSPSFVSNGMYNTNIIIGENGSGKSTLLEVILEIMTYFQVGSSVKKINYNFEIEYICNYKKIKLQKKEEIFYLNIDEMSFENMSYEGIRKEVQSHNIVPNIVIDLYSGFNDKKKKHMQYIEREYRKKCRDIANNYKILYGDQDTFFSHKDELPDEWLIKEEEMPLVSVCYNIDRFSEIFAIMLFAQNCKFEKLTLCKKINIEKLEKVVLEFKNKKTISEDQFNLIVKSIDKRFNDYFYYKNIGKNKFELQISVQDNMDAYSIYNFFEKLYLIFSVNIDVTLKINGKSMNFYDLSEGQRQLIKVLGTFMLTKEKEALILMDEPESHMNPQWKYELREIINKLLQNSSNAQVIIATHDPLIVNGAYNDSVRILKSNDSKTEVIYPIEDTEGLGIDGLLQSEYYGLKTTLDTETQNMLDRRRMLQFKKNRTSQETKELESLSLELQSRGFTRTTRDTLYNKFLERLYSKPEFLNDDILNISKDDIDNIIDEVMDDILEKKQ